jgi:hypothetical protein
LVTLPNGAEISADLPPTLDENLMKLGLTAYLGTLFGLTEIDKEQQRMVLIRYIGSVVTSSEILLKRAKAAEEFDKDNTAHIVEQFLQSLSKEEKKETEE